ncbi:hypothetical protein HMPREF1631_02315 [Arcanobacterium sp. S3PF19]|nr:hypothetical protein HMPREF1631_02315 [Arcanobacterium sp. S3PF19]
MDILPRRHKVHRILCAAVFKSVQSRIAKVFFSVSARQHENRRTDNRNGTELMQFGLSHIIIHIFRPVTDRRNKITGFTRE